MHFGFLGRGIEESAKREEGAQGEEEQEGEEGEARVKHAGTFYTRKK